MNDFMNVVNNKQRLLEKQCSVSGLRLTPLLKIVLAILIEVNEYLSITGIHNLTCIGKRQYYFGSIHRILNKLVAAGSVERHQFDTYKAYFILKGSTRQDHIIDSDTGRSLVFAMKPLIERKKKY